MHKKIFNHDSCKKNKIIVSKKIFTKKRNICDIILRNHRETREMSKDTSRSSMSFFLHKINVIIFCRIHCNLEINDEIKMMTVLHALFVTLK